MTINANEQSWKNQPFVWLLIAIPLSSVIMGIVMLTLAIESDTGLVVDDYYKKGKQINQVIARDQKASAMSLSANIEFDPGSAAVRVSFPGNSWQYNTEVITLGLYHATMPGMDQVLELEKISETYYTSRYTTLKPGRWKIQLATDSWRLVGSLHRPGGNSLKLSAVSPY